MTEITVDRDYLWALEVIASDSIHADDVPSSDYADALRVVRRANLRRPRERRGHTLTLDNNN